MNKEIKKPEFVRLRGRSVKIHVSEDDLREYSKLVTDTTAYMLSVTRLNEMPTMDTIKRSLIPAKIWIAKKLSQKLNEIIEPEFITQLSLDLIPYGGYAKTEFTVIKIVDGIRQLQSFNVALIDSTETPLITKYAQSYGINDPEKLIDTMEGL